MAWFSMTLTRRQRRADLQELDKYEALHRAPSFTPHVTETRPQQALSAPMIRRPQQALRTPAAPPPWAAPRHVQQPRDVLVRVLDGLQKLSPAPRGATPLGDLVASAHVPAGRLPQVSERRVITAAARLGRLAYPRPGGDYTQVLAAVDRITGTTGPRPVLGPSAGDRRAA